MENGTINGVSTDRIADFNMREMAHRRASADPLPGPMFDAFAKDTIAIGEYRVRKVVASDWVALKQSKSPVIEMVLDMQQNAGNPDYTPSETEFSDQKQWELVWQFTHHPKEVRKAIADGTFLGLAETEVGDSIQAPVITLLIAAVMEQLKRSWQTAVKYGTEAEKNGEITFFRDAGASQKTASAGGSST